MYYAKHIFICVNQRNDGRSCCANFQSEKIAQYMVEKLKSLQLWGTGKYRLGRSGCLGRCEQGPCAVIYPEGIWYRMESFSDVDKVLNQHLLEGKLVQELHIS